MMKKILYITNIPAPYTVEFFNDLGKRFDLSVVFEGKNSSERDNSWESFKAKSFKYIIISTEKVIGPLRYPTGIKSILKESKYDFYIVGNYSTPTGMTAISWLRHMKLPYAIHADGGIISHDSIPKYWIKRYFIQNADLYFSSGNITTNYFCHYGAPKNAIREYPFSSVRINQIRKDDDNAKYRKYLGLREEKKTIVSVGQIIYRKGFDVLIKAMSLLKGDAQLYIIGGDPTPELSRLISDLHLSNIHFLPFVPFQTILEYMAAANVFVLLTREDIWGLVINEALSMGTPIISTNKCVAAVEIIENGENGFIVESENPKEAAEKMDYLLDNEELCRRISENNIKKAKRYTIETMCEKYASILDDYFKCHTERI